jgi:hypothetical protein
MKAMPTRLKNGFLLLVAFFVFGASSQAAVCDLKCALQSQPGGCHSAAGISHGPDAMDMSHCSESMPAGTRWVKSHREGNCNHPFVLALEKNTSPGARFGEMQWAVVEIRPAMTALHGRDRIASKSPPLRMAAADPLLISLRV